LHVIVKEGKDLLDCDSNNVSDPYLTFDIDPPNKDQKKQPEYASKVISSTLNPVWNDTVVVPLEKKEKKGLIVHCWDDDEGKFVSISDRDKMGSIDLKFTDCVPLPDGQYHKFYLMGSASPAPGINSVKGSRDARGYIFLNFRYLNGEIKEHETKESKNQEMSPESGEQHKSLGSQRKSLGKGMMKKLF
jgi:hypothetical protein